MLEEGLDRGACSASSQSSIQGDMVGDWRRLGVPGSGSLLLALLLLRMDPAAHPNEASSSLDMKRRAAGEVGLTHGHPKLFMFMSKMDLGFILQRIPRGVCVCVCVSSLGFSFTHPKKMSFQTYTLPSPHPLSHSWPCEHKNNAIT